MRDSNSRGVATNTLSNTADTRLLQSVTLCELRQCIMVAIGEWSWTQV